MAEEKRLKIKLARSTAGRLRAHKACVVGLGLRFTGDERVLADTPEILAAW